MVKSDWKKENRRLCCLSSFGLFKFDCVDKCANLIFCLTATTSYNLLQHSKLFSICKTRKIHSKKLVAILGCCCWIVPILSKCDCTCGFFLCNNHAVIALKYKLVIIKDDKLICYGSACSWGFHVSYFHIKLSFPPRAYRLGLCDWFTLRILL